MSCFHNHDTFTWQLLTLCLLGNFACFCGILIFFQILLFAKNYFRNNRKVSSSLDPDQARHSGPNCFQRLSDDTSRKRIKHFPYPKSVFFRFLWLVNNMRVLCNKYENDIVACFVALHRQLYYNNAFEQCIMNGVYKSSVLVYLFLASFSKMRISVNALKSYLIQLAL